MTKSKVKITAAVSVAIISLLIISMTNHSSQEPPIVVEDESPEISTQNPPQNSTTTEVDFEPPNTADSKEISPESSAPRDNPTPAPAPSNNTTATKACEPKMGDIRTVDGQKQVYFLGFGWIDDNNMPNECIYVEDMYENGNKIGSMGCDAFVDGEGDINKMVGIMD